MNKNVKNIIVIICFVSIIFGFMVSNIIKADGAFSYSERRKLAEFPQFSFEKLFSGDWFEKFEKYSLDQFAFRDGFRTMKAIGAFYLFNQKDNNGIYIVDGNISKFDYSLNEKSVINATEKLNEVYEKYLQGLNVSYALIPDKNYFLATENGCLGIDYDRMQKMMNQNIENMKYIDLFNSLAIEDYYKTDIHWSQDKILKATNKLLNELGSDIQIDESQYSRKELYPFYGSYYRQLALNIAPDKLVYMTNDLLEKYIEFSEKQDVLFVYNTQIINNSYMFK